MEIARTIGTGDIVKIVLTDAEIEKAYRIKKEKYDMEDFHNYVYEALLSDTENRDYMEKGIIEEVNLLNEGERDLYERIYLEGFAFLKNNYSFDNYVISIYKKCTAYGKPQKIENYQFNDSFALATLFPELRLSLNKDNPENIFQKAFVAFSDYKLKGQSTDFALKTMVELLLFNSQAIG